MKAIRVHKFGGPEVLQLDEVADPTPGPGQVLVQVKAAGVNPVDTYVRSGTYAQSPALPYVPGGDAAGVVKALGAGRHALKAGDRVWVVPRGRLRRAGRLRRRDGAPAAGQRSRSSRAPAWACRTRRPIAALHHKAQARPGESVLVHGASGGVGIAAVQLGGRPRHDGHRHRRHRARAQAGRRARRPPRPRPHGARLHQAAAGGDRRRAAPTSSSRCWPT